MTRSPRSRLVVFAFVLLCGILSALEATMRLASPYIERLMGLRLSPTSAFLAEHAQAATALLEDSTTRTVLDPVLGWTYRPGYTSAIDSINGRGLRSAREFATERTPGVRRVAAFGDSFVFGIEVANGETWAAALERHAGDVEVLNYGVGGYGSDQAFLRYLQSGSDFQPDVVLIGFAPINLRRALNVYPRFISSYDAPVAKPRFELVGDSLRLIPNPLPTRAAWEQTIREPRRVLDLGANDEWYDRAQFENPLYDRFATVRVVVSLGVRVWRKYLWADRLLEGEEFRPESAGFALQLKLLETFADSVRRRGAQPVVVIFPDHASLQRVLGASAAGSAARPIYAPLRDSLLAHGRFPVIDLLDAFAAAGSESDIPGWFAPGLHYSPKGNEIVGRWLKDKLQPTTAP